MDWAVARGLAAKPDVVPAKIRVDQKSALPAFVWVSCPN